MKKPRARRWAFCCIVVAISVSLALWANWWKISFRSSRVVGQTEFVLIDRHGSPEYDTRSTPYQRYRPTDEQERIELGLDDDSGYALIWITGFLGQTHAKVHFADGVATGVERGSHR